MNENQIIKPEYILNKIKATKFDENGVKVVDEKKPALILIKTASQRMFFDIETAQNLIKDMAVLIAERKD